MATPGFNTGRRFARTPAEGVEQFAVARSTPCVLVIDAIKSKLLRSEFVLSMGASTNLSRGIHRRVYGLRRVAMLVGSLAFLSSSAPIALADSIGHDDATPVSTSPTTSKTSKTSATDPARSRPEKAQHRPLTRAAARSQIEAISPVDWLNGFGRVEIQTRD